MAETNIRVLVPRVRRALEGPASVPAPFGLGSLTDDEVRDVVADAMSDVILYNGSLFGKDLVIAERDENSIPTEYTTSDELTLPEGSVIAAQAALDYFVRSWSTLKTMESIADEAQTWEWQRSAQLLTAALKQLVADRDRALAAIAADEGIGTDSYTSFLSIRDRHVSAMIEPWTRPGGTFALEARGGGEFLVEDFRFGSGVC